VKARSSGVNSVLLASGENQRTRMRLDPLAQALVLKNMYLTRPITTGRAMSMITSAARVGRGASGPLILAGDANSTEFTPELPRPSRPASRRLAQSAASASASPSPHRRGAWASRPFMRIDYIFHDAAFDAAAIQRIDDASGAGHYSDSGGADFRRQESRSSLQVSAGLAARALSRWLTSAVRMATKDLSVPTPAPVSAFRRERAAIIRASIRWQCCTDRTAPDTVVAFAM